MAVKASHFLVFTSDGIMASVLPWPFHHLGSCYTDSTAHNPFLNNGMSSFELLYDNNFINAKKLCNNYV